MGKKDFNRIVANAERALGASPLSIKLSCFCDRYSPDGNFACMIVYHSYGQFQWTQRQGQGCAAGYKGRTFYVLILCTDNWPDENRRRAGQGMVHDHIYKQYFDMSFTRNKTCCGGFAVMRGETKYSSVWLNQSANPDGKLPWESDGFKELSPPERVIADCAVRAWKQHGPGTVCKAPRLANLPPAISSGGSTRFASAPPSSHSSSSSDGCCVVM